MRLVNGKRKLNKLEKKHEDLSEEIKQKEEELKSLKDQETQDDVRSFRVNKPSGSGANFGNSSEVNKGNTAGDNTQFHIIHLLIAMIGGLALGMLCAKIVFGN